MKPGNYDKKNHHLFTPEELDFLQDNTWKLADSFGLDRRIGNLTDKRPVGFYKWDIECLRHVTEIAGKDATVKLQ